MNIKEFKEGDIITRSYPSSHISINEGEKVVVLAIHKEPDLTSFECNFTSFYIQHDCIDAEGWQYYEEPKPEQKGIERYWQHAKDMALIAFSVGEVTECEKYYNGVFFMYHLNKKEANNDYEGVIKEKYKEITRQEYLNLIEEHQNKIKVGDWAKFTYDDNSVMIGKTIEVDVLDYIYQVSNGNRYFFDTNCNKITPEKLTPQQAKEEILKQYEALNNLNLEDNAE